MTTPADTVISWWVMSGLLIPISIGLLHLTLRGARTLRAWRSFHRGYALAVATARESGLPSVSGVELVVYLRSSCPRCARFEWNVEAPLVEEYGDAVSVERRDATGIPIPVPLVIVRGTPGIMLVDPSHRRLRQLVECTLEGLLVRLGVPGGLLVIDERTRDARSADG